MIDSSPAMHTESISAKKSPRPARKRAPGRPSADSPDLRGRQLEAALACFVRKGIAATSLRDIASEAGVTPALLHYYVGDKAQLQQEVIAQKILPVFAALREPLLQAGDDIAALIAGFVTGIGRIVAKHGQAHAPLEEAAQPASVRACAADDADDRRAGNGLGGVHPFILARARPGSHDCRRYKYMFICLPNPRPPRPTPCRTTTTTTPTARTATRPTSATATTAWS